MRNTISFIGMALAVALLGVAAQKRPPNYNPGKMPDTDFDCSDKIIGGYYGDAETECQMFHVCVKVPGIGVQDFRFLCPNDTAFDQENQVCDDWYNIDCAGQVSAPRAPGSRPSPTPIPLGPSTTRPAVQPAGQNQAAPQGLPPAPRTKPIASNHAGEEDDDFFLQRADTGDRRLHHGTSRDLFKGSQSGSFFNSKNGGKDDDDDYEPDTRPNAFRHSQKAKNPGPLPSFVQQYQQQQQRPVNQQQPAQAQQPRPNNNFQQQQQQKQRPNNNNNFQQQQQQQQRPNNNFQQPQQPQRTTSNVQPTTQAPRQTFPTTQAPRQNFQQPQPQQQNYQQQDAFAQQNNQQRKKKVTVRRKLVQKGDQDLEQNFQQKQQYQQQPQQQYQQQPQQPRRYEEDEEYFRTYTLDQHSNVDSPNQAFGQRGNFPAIRTTIAPITHGPTGFPQTQPQTQTQTQTQSQTQTQGFPSGGPTTAYTAATTTTTVVDAARNHNYQTKARYNTIQRSRGEQPTTATEYFTSPSTPAPTTTQQKQYSLFYAKQQQQQQQQTQQTQTTLNPTTPQPFQQRGSSPAAATTTANNNNRFNYNTYKLNNNGATTADDYEHAEEQEFLKTAHSNNYRASDFNSFNRATTYNKDNGNGAYNTKASTSPAGQANQTTAATKPSSAFPVYFPTSPRPAPFSPPQTTPQPQRQATSSAGTPGTTQQQQQTSAGFNNNNNFYSPQNAPRPFSPSPAPQYSPTSAPSTVAAFNNQFNSNSRPSSSSPSRGPPATAATTAAPPPKKYTAKVVTNQASPTAAAPLKSTKAAASAPKNDYDYAYYDDSDAGAYEYGLDPISDSHFAKTRTDSVKIKKDQ